MKLVILGASGRTGQEIVKQAVERGHSATVVVRDPAKFNASPGVKVARADVTKADELAKIFAGHDAILSGLGNNDSKLRLIERSSAAIAQAMKNAGVRRVIVELSFAGAQAATLSGFNKLITKLMLGKMTVDQQAGASLLRDSGLDWTIAYPTMLTNGPLTRGARIIPDAETIGMGFKISRADVAAFMLDAVEQGKHIRKQPVITELPRLA